MKQAVKEKQTLKFTKFKHQKTQTQSQTTLDCSRLVVNLSSRRLSPVEEEVLALGLSFAIAPRHIPYEEIISATEATARRLDHKSADALRLGVSAALRHAKPPKPNLSAQQRKALHNLKDDTNIVIVPADKGRATVILDKQDYTLKMMETLKDDKYSILRRDPTVRIENKIANTLKRIRNEGHLDEKLCDFLTPRYSSGPQMYGLPKVHKEGTPMRLIVSAIGSPSYNLA